jgi:hypothetical protein
VAKKASRTVHVLERLNWRRCGDGFVRLPGRTRLESFPDAEAAEYARREREEAARQRVNPFRCGGAALHYHTSLDASRLHDWVLDLGLTPPQRRSAADWARWWDRVYPKASAAQRERLWEALDRVRFYEVVERPRKPVVYAVVAINWAYNDNWYVAESEGGKVMSAFRNRKDAEADAEGGDDISRDVWSEGVDEDEDMFDLKYRLAAREVPATFDKAKKARTWEDYLVTLGEAPFYEVIEIELEE